MVRKVLNKLIAKLLVCLFITTTASHSSNSKYKIRSNDGIPTIDYGAEHLHDAHVVVENMGEACRKYRNLQSALCRYTGQESSEQGLESLKDAYEDISKAMFNLIESEARFLSEESSLLNPYFIEIYSQELPNDSLLTLLQNGIEDSLKNYQADNSIKSIREVLGAAERISSHSHDHTNLYYIYTGLAKRESNFLSHKSEASRKFTKHTYPLQKNHRNTHRLHRSRQHATH